MNPVLVRVLVVAVLLVLACGFGLRRRSRDGRARREGGDLRVHPGELGSPLGDRATLLQISTQFCAPCRAARLVLGRVAESTPGVRHVEVDAEEHLGLIRRLTIRRTPTVLVLDGSGVVVSRTVGVPTAEQVRTALPAAAGGRDVSGRDVSGRDVSGRDVSDRRL